jgi:hypothetical protein
MRKTITRNIILLRTIQSKLVLEVSLSPIFLNSSRLKTLRSRVTAAKNKGCNIREKMMNEVKIIPVKVLWITLFMVWN